MHRIKFYLEQPIKVMKVVKSKNLIYYNDNKFKSIYAKHNKKNGASDRSAQSRVKIRAQCKAFSLYQEEHSQGCSYEELPEATESQCQSWWCHPC